MGVERDALINSQYGAFKKRHRTLTSLLCCCSLRNCKTNSENGIGTELGLVWGSVKLDQELVNLGLVLDVNVFLDNGWANDIVDIGDSFCDTFSTPLALISIAELACLVLTYILISQPSLGSALLTVRTGGSSGRNDSSVETCLGDDINLNRWVTARVVDRPSVNLGDRHSVVSSA
jgi:hypothetical protein